MVHRREADTLIIGRLEYVPGAIAIRLEAEYRRLPLQMVHSTVVLETVVVATAASRPWSPLVAHSGLECAAVARRGPCGNA